MSEPAGESTSLSAGGASAPSPAILSSRAGAAQPAALAPSNRAAPSASNAAVVVAASAGESTSSSGSASSTAWEDLPPLEQVMALTDAELKETIVRCWVRPNIVASIVDTWSMADCRRVAPRLKLMPSSSVSLFRASIRRVMNQWAREEPTWLLDTDVEEEETRRELQERKGRNSRAQPASSSRRAASPSPVTATSSAAVQPPPSARNPPSLQDQAALAALLALPAVAAGGASPRRVSIQAPASASSRSNPVALASSSAAPQQLAYDPDDDSDSEDDELGLGLSVGLPSARTRRVETAVNMEALGISAPFAAPYLDNVLRGQATDSVLRVFKALEFKNSRNRGELLALAKVVDFARKGETAMAIEWACRRMAGVHTADQSGNWQVSDVFEMNTASQSYVPAGFLQMALKQVARVAAISKTHTNAYGKGQQGGGGKTSGAKSKSNYGAGGGASGGFSSSATATSASSASKPSGSNKK